MQTAVLSGLHLHADFHAAYQVDRLPTALALYSSRELEVTEVTLTAAEAAAALLRRARRGERTRCQQEGCVYWTLKDDGPLVVAENGSASHWL